MEKGVHKKPQIKGCSLCSVSPVLCWNGRNVAGRPTESQSLQPLMNFSKAFFIQSRVLANSMSPGQAPRGDEGGERRIEGWRERRRRCWQSKLAPRPGGVLDVPHSER